MRSFYITAAMFVAFVAFFVIRAMVLEAHESKQSVEVTLVLNLLALAPDAASRLATEVLILGGYLKQLFIPYPLIFFYGPGSIPFRSFGDVWVLVSAAAYLLLAGIAIYRMYRLKADPFAFGIWFYLCTISLFSNFFFLVGTAFANRFAFFPSAGFCICVAFLFDRWVASTRVDEGARLPGLKYFAVLVPVVSLYAAMTIMRNKDWESNGNLCRADAPKAPNDSWVQYNAGVELQKQYEAEPDSAVKRQLNEQSIGHLKRAIDIYPGNSEAHADLGVAYVHDNNAQLAETHLKQAVSLNPIHLNALTNLATLLFMNQQFAEAVTYYEKAILIDLNSDLAYYNLGICHARLGHNDLAIACFKKVMDVSPQFDNYKSPGNIAILYEAMGNMDSARKYERITQRYFPEFHLKQ